MLSRRSLQLWQSSRSRHFKTCRASPHLRGLQGLLNGKLQIAEPDWLERAQRILKVAGGVVMFLGFDSSIRWLIDTSGISMLPSQICSMLGAFGGLSMAQIIAPSGTAVLHQALLPAVAWVGRWLPVFLVPVQVMLPTINFPGGAAEATGLAVLLGVGWFSAVALGARLVTGLTTATGIAAVNSTSAAAAKPLKISLLLPFAWLALAALVSPVGVIPEQFQTELAKPNDEWARFFRGLTLASVGIGSFALAMRQGLPGHLCFLSNGAATIAAATAMATLRGESYAEVVKRDYLVGSSGPPGSGDWLLWCLGPALVSTGVQMFQYRSRIVNLSSVLFISCTMVSLGNILGTVIVGPILGISPEVTLAATMRCVTIPMALPTYDRLCLCSGAENNVALVALCAGLSGFIGFGFSQRLLTSIICQAPTDPVARGIATGAAAHALGAACLVASEPEAFVWGMLAMAASGVASSAWICACPPLRELSVSLAYRNDPRKIQEPTEA